MNIQFQKRKYTLWLPHKKSVLKSVEKREGLLLGGKTPVL
jgi:hypothetical protein